MWMRQNSSQSPSLKRLLASSLASEPHLLLHQRHRALKNAILRCPVLRCSGLGHPHFYLQKSIRFPCDWASAMVGEKFKGQVNRGNKTESLRGKSASQKVSKMVFVWEGFSEVFRGFERFLEVFRGFQRFQKLFRGFKDFFRSFRRSSQRPSQRQISSSEALSPVAPNRVAP